MSAARSDRPRDRGRALASRAVRVITLALLALALPPLLGAPAATTFAAERVRRQSPPHIGYVYPAGGQIGTAVEVTVGGQALRGLRGVVVSGGGVTGEVGRWLGPPRPLRGAEGRLLRRTLATLRRKLLTPDAPKPARPKSTPAPQPPKGAPAPAGNKPPVVLPKHPLLEGLETKDLDGLAEVARYFLSGRNPLQRKRAIEETLRLRLTIAPDAAPGFRELRVVGPRGLSSPIRFHVGRLAETQEHIAPERQQGEAPHALPIVLNGRILPRERDRFRLALHAGQHLVARIDARHLIPFQADAVPGWLQATIALLGPDGKELAFSDEFRYDPDPVLVYDVPRDGTYALEIRDALSRGRGDFVYRVEVGELPLVTSIFPLGGRAGVPTIAELQGVNLRARHIELDTTAGTAVRALRLPGGLGPDPVLRYAVGTLPETLETEPNAATPEPATPARIINGQIGAVGDVDRFQFKGQAGDEFVIELVARALGSPLDGVLRVTDAAGHVLAWNDDPTLEAGGEAALGVRAVGRGTHHADPTLEVTLPATGPFIVEVTDATRHGGPAYAYRLRVGPRRPDAEVFVVPSSLNVPAGGRAPVSIRIRRREGFTGAVDVALVDAPPGYVLEGGHVPAGQDRVHMTVSAPWRRARAPQALRLVARLTLDGKPVERPVIPAEDVMQAFLWRHLVPSADLLVALVGARGPRMTRAESRPGVLHLVRGSQTTLRLRVQWGRAQPNAALRFQLVDPPRGISLGAPRPVAGGLELDLRASADADLAASGTNLIVEALAEVQRRRRARKGAKPKANRQLVSFGYLPAIPIELAAAPATAD